MAISDAIVISVTIPSGDTVGPAVYIGSAKVTGLQVPTIESSKIEFQGSADNDSYYDVVDDSLNKLGGDAGTGEYLINLDGVLEGPAWIKIVLGSSQAVDRTFKLILKAH